MKPVGILSILACAALCQAISTPRSGAVQYKRDAAPPKDPQYQLSKDADFHFEILRSIGYASAEGSDVGEILVAAEEIKPGDYESWYSAYYKLAERVQAQANSIDIKEYPISARNAHFRAASYYRSADFFLHANWSDPRIISLWKQQTAAFDIALALLPVPGQRITLYAKNKEFEIPAIFYGNGQTEPRPTLILGNGYDGSQEEMYHVIGQAALQRGMNVISYEGPGQPSVRRYQDLGFIPDWEKVVIPVVDYLVSRSDVDKDSIGLYGYSFGGYLAPRAAAYEHRLAAVMANDGVWDFGQSLLDQFPPQLLEVFHSGNVSLFNELLTNITDNPQTPTNIRWAMQQGEWSFKLKKPFDFVTAAQLYNLTGLPDLIKAPVWVAEAEDDLFFGTQAKELANKLGEKGTFQYFNASSGAGQHCSIGAGFMLNNVMLDWFENILAENKANLGQKHT